MRSSIQILLFLVIAVGCSRRETTSQNTQPVTWVYDIRDLIEPAESVHFDWGNFANASTTLPTRRESAQGLVDQIRAVLPAESKKRGVQLRELSGEIILNADINAQQHVAQLLADLRARRGPHIDLEVSFRRDELDALMPVVPDVVLTVPTTATPAPVKTTARATVGNRQTARFAVTAFGIYKPDRLANYDTAPCLSFDFKPLPALLCEVTATSSTDERHVILELIGQFTPGETGIPAPTRMKFTVPNDGTIQASYPAPSVPDLKDAVAAKSLTMIVKATIASPDPTIRQFQSRSSPSGK